MQAIRKPGQNDNTGRRGLLKIWLMGCAVVLLLGNNVLLSDDQPRHANDTVFFDEGPLAGQGYPFSESVRTGNLLFLSGQIGEDGSGKPVPGGIKAEANQVLLNITKALERRGLGLEHVVKCTVFLVDIDEWGAFNEVYKQYFKPPYPARSALAASGLAIGARVEVECIAHFPG